MTPFQRAVFENLGVLPNFFCSAPSAPGLVEALWSFTKSAYIDSPLPPVFKERLCVHLSRFCDIRYCIVRHVGFLVSRPAGDEHACPHTVDQVIALLAYPIPDATHLSAAFERLNAQSPVASIPDPETQLEKDVFDALTVVFLEPSESARAREAIKTALGKSAFEVLVAFLTFVRTTHFWSESHPDLAYESDVLDVMEARPDLAALLLDPADAAKVKNGKRLRAVLDELHQTEATLRESEKRLRALVLAGASAVFCMSPDWHEMRQLEGAQFPTNTRIDDERWLDTYIVADNQMQVRVAIDNAIERKDTFDLEHRVRRADGTIGWVHSRAVPILDDEGQIVEWFGTTTDISKRKEIEAKLALNDERLQMALAASGQVGLWDWIVDSDLLFGDAHFARLYGLNIDQAAAGLTMAEYQEFVVPEDLTPLQEKIKAVFDRGADFLIDYRVSIPNEPLKWVECKGRMIYDDAGAPLRFSGTAVDITERKSAEQQKHLLMQELSHRVNNTFAVVQAIAAQSLRAADREIVQAFQQRLASLSRAHDVLLQASWSPTPVGTLLHSVLRLETEGHLFDLTGPEFRIGPKAALSMSLLMHELATNATKYGALSIDAGRVLIGWEFYEDTFRLTWREVGGPPVSPPEKTGFGSRLIEAGIGGAKHSHLTYGPDGFSAIFIASKARISEDA